MKADKAIAILEGIASKYQPAKGQGNFETIDGLKDKDVYSALLQGRAALQSNQEAVDVSDLIERQRGLMQSLGMPTQASKDILDDIVYKDVLIMMGGEVHEAIEPLLRSTKPWKNQNLDDRREHAREELIDVLFFFLEACVLQGFTGKDIEARYEAKRQKNFTRLKAATQSSEMPKFIVAGVQEPEPDPDKEHEILLAACQRAAGLFGNLKARSSMWETVWQAEANLETLRRDPKANVQRPYSVLIDGISKLKPMMDAPDINILTLELIKEMGDSLKGLIMDKAGYDA